MLYSYSHPRRPLLSSWSLPDAPAPKNRPNAQRPEKRKVPRAIKRSQTRDSRGIAGAAPLSMPQNGKQSCGAMAAVYPCETRFGQSGCSPRPWGEVGASRGNPATDCPLDLGPALRHAQGLSSNLHVSANVTFLCGRNRHSSSGKQSDRLGRGQTLRRQQRRPGCTRLRHCPAAFGQPVIA